MATARPNSSGDYALTVPGGLAVGNNALSVVYSGDTHYTGVTATLNTVTVAKGLLSTSVTAAFGTATIAGQPYTVNATISGTLASNTPRTGDLALMEGNRRWRISTWP